MNTLQKIYRKDRHITRLLIMMVVWMVFMAITKFDKFYAIANFQTIAGKFPEFGLMSLGAMLCMITGGIDLSSVGIANMTSILMALYMRSRARSRRSGDFRAGHRGSAAFRSRHRLPCRIAERHPDLQNPHPADSRHIGRKSAADRHCSGGDKR